MKKEEKMKQVEELKKDIENSAVVGIIDVNKMPSRELQEIRKGLRNKAKVKIVKKVVFKFALDGAKKEKIQDLESMAPSQPGLIFSDLDAFKLYAIIDGLRFKTFAKDGDIANEDIWVSAGPTSIMAGPAISEFQQAGVKAGIESGKIAIKKDACVVKKGDVISGVKADILRKLKVKPMEVVLKVAALYQNGDIFKGEVLGMVTEFPKMLPRAFNHALNLSVHITYPTKENITHLLVKAIRAANSISGLVGNESKKEENEPEKAEEDNKESETSSENGGAE